MSGVRDALAVWVQVLEGRRSRQLQAECERVHTAAEAAIQAIRDEVAELTQELQRACVGTWRGHCAVSEFSGKRVQVLE